MNRRFYALPLLALLGFAATANADTLLLERTQDSASNLPVRGWSMAQVEAKYGTPQQRLDPRGGQKRQWPAINRWVYPNFTVYFENSKVIDVVANKVSPEERGPKPAIR